jgi:hypothetical protein
VALNLSDNCAMPLADPHIAALIAAIHETTDPQLLCVNACEILTRLLRRADDAPLRDEVLKDLGDFFAANHGAATPDDDMMTSIRAVYLDVVAMVAAQRPTRRQANDGPDQKR